ncbi:serine--tRNA ligase [Magnetococcales bacterium HHB-1]
MLDLKQIRQNPEDIENALKRRDAQFTLSDFQVLEAEKRALQTETETLQARRNALSKEIGLRKRAKENADDLLAEMKTVGPKLGECSKALKEKEHALQQMLALFPNPPHPSVPSGDDENDNVEVHRWPQNSKDPDPLPFTAKPHWEVGEHLGLLDFTAGAKVAGARFTVFKGAGARLNRALISFMLDLHTQEHGYTEVLPPFMANAEALFGTGQLPKFEEDLFCTRDDALFLIPTAEVPITNLVREQILDQKALPLKMAAWTACFRREAGAAGQDTRGLIRQHQFDKVELVHITHPDHSYEALEALTEHAEEVLKRLELPFRRITLCTGDMGFSAAKTYDLEVWLPGQGCYREISSCSNTEDFQARRMKARFRDAETRKPRFVHTLNGSGVAVGRTLVAILENYQTEDGSLRIPKALQPYMNGEEIITA